ncbi:hypothetical protein LZ198_11850 [Myxococcus sp. K15C18031901]|uniref:hypothetical protein n=1 Tax=Myxococcus dinghuensis TaxID=2906761 RepID=UPI0020A763A3|nr:hypothetical protein [Myxococcus dinghuensis]MCP3099560.1 hypothetical protein [Myxococcus dinghuensis]
MVSLGFGVVFVVGFGAGLFVREWAEALVSGPAETLVLGEDVALEFAKEDDSCPGSPAGGLMAGTRLQVRNHGPFRTVELRLSYISNKELPRREVPYGPPAGFEKRMCVRPPVSILSEPTQ